MFGSLAIQAGENPRVIEEKLLALLPTWVATAYRDKQEVQERRSLNAAGSDDGACLGRY